QPRAVSALSGAWSGGGMLEFVADTICAVTQDTSGIYHEGTTRRRICHFSLLSRCAVAVSSRVLGQHCENPNAELSEISDVDRAIVVPVKVGQKASLAGIQIEGRGEQSEIGNIHVGVARGIAEQPKQPVGKRVVAAGSSVVIAVE